MWLNSSLSIYLSISYIYIVRFQIEKTLLYRYLYILYTYISTFSLFSQFHVYRTYKTNELRQTFLFEIFSISYSIHNAEQDFPIKPTIYIHYIPISINVYRHVFSSTQFMLANFFIYTGSHYIYIYIPKVFAYSIYDFGWV